VGHAPGAQIIRGDDLFGAGGLKRSFGGILNGPGDDERHGQNDGQREALLFFHESLFVRTGGVLEKMLLTVGVGLRTGLIYKFLATIRKPRLPVNRETDATPFY
jgi:hypothetical protein